MDIPETDSEDEIPPGWEERCTADGLVFYASHESKTTQWTHPRTGKKKRVTGELPYGWEREIEEEGKVFFVDHVNEKTTYVDPRLAFAVEETPNLKDLRQRFDASSSGFQVAHGKDLSDQIAIITGANSGIGYETARTLAFQGCVIVFACRNLNSAEESIKKLKLERAHCTCKAMHLDLSALKSVKNFVKEFLTQYRGCDILILNAGVFGVPFSLTEDSLEMTFQVNFLSQFYLALLLQPIMTRASSGRVVFVAAESHRFGNLTQSDRIMEIMSPNERQYQSVLAYNNSKLCSILGCFELHRRFDDLGLRCYAVHPGNVLHTNLPRNWWGFRVLFSLVQPFTKSLQQGCASSIYCATSPDIINCGGIYINNCCPCLPSEDALNPILANKLWNKSLEVIECIMGKNAFIAEK